LRAENQRLTRELAKSAAVVEIGHPREMPVSQSRH